MMELSFAQALNEAKQVIVQQATRIKADSDKMKIQQEMLMSQSQTIGDQERRITDQSAQIERQAIDIDALTLKLAEAVKAREQAEAIINRQGERITHMQNTAADLERKIGEQSERIHELDRERESLSEKLPTRDDIEALAAMSSLLTKKAVSPSQSTSHPQMRLAEAA